MKYIRYGRYTGEPADSVDLQELMKRLSDFLLQSGFESQFYGISEMDPERSMENLRQAILRALQEGDLLPDDQLSEEMRELLQNSDALTNQQVRDLIDQQLLLQKGKDLGITGDTELVKRLDEMRKEMKLETMEELEKAAEAQGASYEDFKQNLRNQIVTQRVIGQEVGSHLAMNKDDVKKFYDQHKAEMERLFPDADIIKEKVLGLTKSLIAVRAAVRAVLPERRAPAS